MAIGAGGGSVVPLARLAVRSGPGAGDEHVVDRPVVTIGKSAQCEVVLADDSVSARHARLEYGPSGWLITDLGSTNGTWLVGARLEPQIATEVAPGARVRVGGVELELLESEGVDLEAARAAYVPGSAPARNGRSAGFRLPLWVLLVLLLVLGLVIVYLGWIRSEPPAEPATVPTTAEASVPIAEAADPS